MGRTQPPRVMDWAGGGSAPSVPTSRVILLRQRCPDCPGRSWVRTALKPCENPAVVARPRAYGRPCRLPQGRRRSPGRFAARHPTTSGSRPRNTGAPTSSRRSTRAPVLRSGRSMVARQQGILLPRLIQVYSPGRETHPSEAAARSRRTRAGRLRGRTSRRLPLATESHRGHAGSEPSARGFEVEVTRMQPTFLEHQARMGVWSILVSCRRPDGSSRSATSLTRARCSTSAAASASGPPSSPAPIPAVWSAWTSRRR